MFPVQIEYFSLAWALQAYNWGDCHNEWKAICECMASLEHLYVNYNVMKTVHRKLPLLEL